MIYLAKFCEECHFIGLVYLTVGSLDTLLSISQKTHESQTTQPKKIGEGQSVVAVWAIPTNKPAPQAMTTPMDLVQNSHYCHYCSIHCNSEKQWLEHRASDKHMFNVNSDKEHQWNYRQPPWGVPGGHYELCTRYSTNNNKKLCHLWDVIFMTNFIVYMHTEILAK